MDSSTIPAVTDEEKTIQINAAISEARTNNPDIDFGSLDDDYTDLQEPILDITSNFTSQDITHE